MIAAVMKKDCRCYLTNKMSKARGLFTENKQSLIKFEKIGQPRLLF